MRDGGLGAPPSRVRAHERSLWSNTLVPAAAVVAAVGALARLVVFAIVLLAVAWLAKERTAVTVLALVVGGALGPNDTVTSKDR
jgi:hypothetical protein